MFQVKYIYDASGKEWHETTEDKVRRAIRDWYKDRANLKMAELKNGEIVPTPHTLFRWIPDAACHIGRSAPPTTD